MVVISTIGVRAQLSPGDLTTAHSHLDGISNCTQCHVLGNKVSSEKCLVCHTEIKERIDISTSNDFLLKIINEHGLAAEIINGFFHIRQVFYHVHQQ